MVERQNYNIFDHSGCEENQIRKIQLPNFNVKKDDNRDLFNSLKKSYLEMGHEQKNNLNSTSS